jgi:hypothetical protein
MSPRGSSRLPWRRLPPHVRRAVERALGAEVLDARTATTGFSLGCASRVRLSNGRTAFVKATGVRMDPGSYGLYQTEAATMPRLPPGLPVPRLLDVHDDGEWLALIYDEVAGQHPDLPWQAHQLERVAASIEDLAAALRPSPWSEAQSFWEANEAMLQTWHRLATYPPNGVEPWLAEVLGRFAADGVDLREIVAGDTLLHADIRFDNVLVTPEGRAIILGWGWTCNGAAWLDLICFAMFVEVEGGPDPDLLLRTSALTRDVDPRSIDAMLLAVGANYWWSTHRPRPPAVPRTAAWRRQQQFLDHHRRSAEGILRWLRRRTVELPVR